MNYSENNTTVLQAVTFPFITARSCIVRSCSLQHRGLARSDMATWGPTAGQLRATGPTCWATGASRGLGRRLQFGENMSFAFMRWPTTAARRYKQREIDWFRRAEYEYVGTSASVRARRRRPTSCAAAAVACSRSR